MDYHTFNIEELKNHSKFFLLLFPRMLQSVQRHSATVLTFTTNGMQELLPVMYLLFKVQSQLIVGGHSKYESKNLNFILKQF